MIIKTESIKLISSKILCALDSSENSILATTLEMKASGKMLYFNVTNNEYYVRVGIQLDTEQDFHATVNADMFLKLISQITTDTVELEVTNNVLSVVGNGKFNIPLKFDFDKLIEIVEIPIEAVTQSFEISTAILNSIVNYNSREIAGNAFNDVMRKSFYIDGDGCITFNQCACVNNFTLEKPVKFILTPKVVKLFRLFNSDNVMFELGFNQIGEKIQTVVRFSDSTTMLVAKTLPDDGLMNKFPSKELRQITNKVYPFSTSIGKNEFMQALNRFTIFSNYDVNTTECRFNFLNDSLIIEDNTGNIENIQLMSPIEGEYKALLDIDRLKVIVDSSKDFSMINLKFGDRENFVFSRGTVFNILPESVEQVNGQ